ncbi:MAG: hypothetical protein JWP27_2678 [Flaviaesturariibacter sp.]|nr:hypothetical protein [Flaviaesturariibacter sp.]
MKRIILLLVLFVSLSAAAQDNLLSLAGLPNYREWTTFATKKKQTHLKVIVFYDDPAKKDEEVSYVLDITMPDSVLAPGRVIDLVRDSGFVKWVYLKRSLRDIAPARFSGTGQVSVVSLSKKELVVGLTIVVSDDEKKKKVYYIGTRTFVKESQ